jgi:hypothetical protein
MKTHLLPRAAALGAVLAGLFVLTFGVASAQAVGLGRSAAETVPASGSGNTLVAVLAVVVAVLGVGWIAWSLSSDRRREAVQATIATPVPLPGGRAADESDQERKAA